MAVYPLAAAPEFKTVRPADTSRLIALVIRPNHSWLSFARLRAPVIIPASMSQPLPEAAIYFKGSDPSAAIKGTKVGRSAVGTRGLDTYRPEKRRGSKSHR